MKKLIIVFLLIFGYSQAQNVEFGAKAGVNFSTLGGDETDNIDGKTGFHYGLVAEIPFTKNFAFQPEVLYSAQGAKDSDMNATYPYKEDFTFDYINVPLLAKYSITPGLSLHAGPQVGFLVKAEGEIEYDVPGGDVYGDADLKDDIKNLDFALAAGLGYQLDIGVFLNARYNLGLSNIIDDDEVSEDFSRQNNVFQLSIGYMF